MLALKILIVAILMLPFVIPSVWLVAVIVTWLNESAEDSATGNPDFPSNVKGQP